jgi:hypothetical protein
MKKAPVRKMTPTKKILDEETTEQHEERRSKLDNLIIEVDDKLKENENNMIDNGTLGSLNDSYQAAVKWSNVLNWLSQVKTNRYIIPEQAKKIQEEQAKRNGQPIKTEGGIFIPTEAETNAIVK